MPKGLSTSSDKSGAAKKPAAKKSVKAIALLDVADKNMKRSYQRSGVVASGALLPSGTRQATAPVTPAVAERSPAAGAKGSVNLRIERGTRQLIDDAAAVLGKTRTEFMIESARKVAIDVLLDQRLFVLDPERYDAFVHAFDNPPAPGPKLRALLRRAPTWET